MLEDLADSISRHGKIILAVWIVAVLILVPPAVKSFESMDYGIHDITDPDSESSVADDVVSRFFDEPEVDLSRIPLLVIEYQTRDGYRQLQGDEDISLEAYTEYLRNGFVRDSDWIQKLDLTNGGVMVLATYGDESSGAILMGFFYDRDCSQSSIESDTGNLRSKVASLTDDYMYDLYEDGRHFDTYVTGSGALTHDIGSGSRNALAVTVGLAVLITLILTGLFFGSAMSSLISLISITFASIVSMATVFGFSEMFGMFFVPGILLLLVVVLMVFVHCMYVVSTYRDELLNGKERGSALYNTVLRTGRAIFSSTTCVMFCSVVLALMCDGVFFRFGVCMTVASVIVMVASLTVPASVIHVTRNELFWTATPDEKVRFGSFQKVYNRVSGLFGSVSSSLSHIGSGRAKAILAVTILASAGCAVFLDDRGLGDETPYDLMDSIATGESKAGLEVLEEYGYGGIFHPYTVVLGFAAPVGRIATDDTSGLPAVTWTDRSVFTTMETVAGDIASSDEANISSVKSLIDWESVIARASSGEEDYDSVLENVREILSGIDMLATMPYEEVVLKLRLKGLSSQEIVESHGPEMDYAVNHALGYIGYEMTGSKDVIVTHIRMTVVTSASALSSESLGTSDTILERMGSYDLEGNGLYGIWITGAGIIYYEFLDSVDSGFDHTSAVVCIVLIVLLMLLTLSMGSSLRCVLTTVMSILMSLTVTELIAVSVWESVSMTVQVAMVILAVALGIWFDMVQDNHVRRLTDNWTDRKVATGDMLAKAHPVIIVSTLILAVCFGALATSSIQMISQMGLTFMVCTLIDVFVVRTLVSPLLFSGCWRKRRA